MSQVVGNEVAESYLSGQRLKPPTSPVVPIMLSPELTVFGTRPNRAAAAPPKRQLPLLDVVSNRAWQLTDTLVSGLSRLDARI
jgi:hypothetical protein